jgi:hypothetical protein
MVLFAKEYFPISARFPDEEQRTQICAIDQTLSIVNIELWSTQLQIVGYYEIIPEAISEMIKQCQSKWQEFPMNANLRISSYDTAS